MCSGKVHNVSVNNKYTGNKFQTCISEIMSSATDVIVDALPYIDHGYDEPGVREAALAMVEEETRRYRPTRNYLDHLPALNLASFETDLMRTEFERLSSRQSMDTLSMKRYELPTPPPGKMTDVQAWSEVRQ